MDQDGEWSRDWIASDKNCHFSGDWNYDHEIEIVIFHEIEGFEKIMHNCSGDQKGLRDPGGSLFKP